MHTCQACQKLKRRTSYCTTGQKSQVGQAVCSWLKLATQPSREVKQPKHPVWENLTFHIPSHPTIYIPLYPRFRESFQREFLIEKPQRKTRLTHPQSLPKRLFKFLYSLPLHCQILKRLITKTFSHHIHFYERVVWCFGKQLGRNQFHIGWMLWSSSEIQEARKEIGSAQPRWSKKLGRLRYIGQIRFGGSIVVHVSQLHFLVDYLPLGGRRRDFMLKALVSSSITHRCVVLVFTSLFPYLCLLFSIVDVILVGLDFLSILFIAYVHFPHTLCLS